jgi:hypothetical protein
MWVTYEDIKTAWINGALPANKATVDAYIVYAEEVVKSEYPKIQERIDDGRLSIDRVKLVVVSMVMRVLNNPTNLKSWQQMSGPFSSNRTFSNSQIWLEENEKKLLAPSKYGKAFEQDLAARYWDLADGIVWVDTDGD